MTALRMPRPRSCFKTSEASSRSYHITVKGGKYLEALANADTIVFDKTGTVIWPSSTTVPA